MFYSICYDVRDDRRRARLVKVLKDFGDRVQFSVFEANLRADELERLKKRAVKVLDLGEDSLRIYQICAACASRVEIFGQGTITQDPDVIVI